MGVAEMGSAYCAKPTRDSPENMARFEALPSMEKVGSAACMGKTI